MKAIHFLYLLVIGAILLTTITPTIVNSMRIAIVLMTITLIYYDIK